MTRQTVTPDELASLMTQKLQHLVGHKDCRFRPTLPHEPDEDGCSWSPLFTRSGRSKPECEAEVNEVIQWARQRYNVKFP
jgi:hypothetical protein